MSEHRWHKHLDTHTRVRKKGSFVLNLTAAYAEETSEDATYISIGVFPERAATTILALAATAYRLRKLCFFGPFLTLLKRLVWMLH